MFSVGLIVPTWHYYDNPFKVQPLNKLYFATVLDSYFSGKIKVNLVDLRPSRLNNKKLDNVNTVHFYVPEYDLYLYWIAKTADYNEIASVVTHIRQIYPKAKHAAGGTHVDNFPQECTKIFDAIVLGPGEEAFIKIINDCLYGSLKKLYRGDWKDVHYNNYPFTRRHYLPEKDIVNTLLFEKYGSIPATSAMFSRGCNFKCTYCVYNVPHSIQMRSPDKIEEEINYLKNTYHIKGVNLRDEICIPLSSKIAIPYLEAIGRTDIIWRGQTRIGASRKVISLARDTGCVELAIGVESAFQDVLNIIKKKQKLEQVREFIEICKSTGIKVKMCLILGLPGEPQNIVKMTLSFIEETKPDYVSISGFCPVPGSEIFNNPDYYGIKYIDRDWSKHAHLLFRFNDEENFGIPFNYEETNRWGKTFSRSEIINNIKELQHYVREHNMCY